MPGKHQTLLHAVNDHNEQAKKYRITDVHTPIKLYYTAHV